MFLLPGPSAHIGKSFKYLGRHFNFTMDTHNYMSEVLDIFSGLTKTIDCIPCYLKSKLLLYNCFVLSKVPWHFTMANLSKTWVLGNVDNHVSSLPVYGSI